MKYIIFDCDSTVGLPGKPMDDALALLYLLGRSEEVRVLGITCTFANGTAREVYQSTRRLLEEIGRTDIPLLPGADAGEDPRSDAARFIAKTVSDRPGEVSLLAIGSMTNLYGAYLLDSAVFEKTKEIVLMGGYTAPVLYHNRHLEELNFSVNPAAAACVLNRGKNISILTGNNTLEPSYLPKEEFIEKMCCGIASDPDRRLPHQSVDRFAMTSHQYIAEKCGYRFEDKAIRDGEAASYCWDAVAAVYLLHPELFEDHPRHCFLTERTMHGGWLGVTGEAPDTCRLNLPEVKDLAAYREEMYGGWLNFRMGGAV